MTSRRPTAAPTHQSCVRESRLALGNVGDREELRNVLGQLGVVAPHTPRKVIAAPRRVAAKRGRREVGVDALNRGELRDGRITLGHAVPFARRPCGCGYNRGYSRRETGPRIAAQKPWFERKSWSRRSDSNRGPAVYETAALPLSYAGAVEKVTTGGGYDPGKQARPGEGTRAVHFGSEDAPSPDVPACLRFQGESGGPTSPWPSLGYWRDPCTLRCA